MFFLRNINWFKPFQLRDGACAVDNCLNVNKRLTYLSKNAKT
jgi:hypothetical protein